jgi:D-alanyl-D-alanine-carboxypeptidase/D-alanyl-D-alanine-endopeptidase
MISATIARMVLAAACAAAAVQSAHAQLSGAATDVPALARSALGSEVGVSSVATWRNGTLTSATVFRAEPRGEIANWPQAQAPMFEIGSVSKVFTGLLLAQAVEKGELSLDDKLGVLLKDQVPTMQGYVASITLRQLVTHTSCLPRTVAPRAPFPVIAREIRTMTREQLWAAMLPMRIASAPPCAGVYSNLGFALLGEIISLRYGKPWDQLVAERITQPLGMKDTLVQLGDMRERMAAPFDGEDDAPFWDMAAYQGAGGVRSTAADMIIFARAIGAGRAGPLGTAAERLVTPLDRHEGADIGYAVLMRGPAGKRVLLHNGLTAGYQTLWMVLPQGEALFSSVSNAQAPATKVVNAVDVSLFPVATAPVPIAREALAAYEGLYRVNADISYRVIAGNGILNVRFGRPQGFFPLVHVAPDRFTRTASGGQFDFTRQEGRVTGMNVSVGGRTLVATRDDKEFLPAYVIPPEAALPAYVGRYKMPWGAVLDVSAEGSQLLARMTKQRRFPVFALPGATDRFAYDIVKAELQFERDAQGKVVALVLHQNGQHRAPRVND